MTALRQIHLVAGVLSQRSSILISQLYVHYPMLLHLIAYFDVRLLVEQGLALPAHDHVIGIACSLIIDLHLSCYLVWRIVLLGDHVVRLAHRHTSLFVFFQGRLILLCLPVLMLHFLRILRRHFVTSRECSGRGTVVGVVVEGQSGGDSLRRTASWKIKSMTVFDRMLLGAMMLIQSKVPTVLGMILLQSRLVQSLIWRLALLLGILELSVYV